MQRSKKPPATPDGSVGGPPEPLRSRQRRPRHAPSAEPELIDDAFTRYLPGFRSTDDEDDARGGLTLDDTRHLAEIANTLLVRVWSGIQVRRFHDVFKNIDCIEDNLKTLHVRAIAGLEAELRYAANLHSGPDTAIPPYRVNSAAQPHLQSICERWLPTGKRLDYQRGGPVWYDRWRPGGVSVSLKTGAWFMHDASRGGEDIIALAEHLFDMTRQAATRETARMVGLIDIGDDR